MKYDFKCTSCDARQTVDLSISAFEEKKAGIPCPQCDGVAFHHIDFGGVTFSFKGDAWADKNYREKNYRKTRSAYMSQRQAQNNKMLTLVPNYQGEEAETWQEVKEVAAAAGKDTSSYEPWITREH